MTRFAAACLGASLLVGCALVPERAIVGHPSSDAFEVKGRIAVRYAGDGYTGTMRWKHSQVLDTVELYTPIGTLYARLTQDADGAVMETADGKRFAERDAGALSRRVLGWELPLADLPHWMFGDPAPQGGVAEVVRSPDGQAQQLEQSGWRVRYRSYFSDAPTLPDRLELDRPGLTVKMIVSHWRGAT
jgi:outer membrane lipoprotein LolB